MGLASIHPCSPPMTRVGEGEGESGLSNLQVQVEGGREVWGGVTVVAVLARLDVTGFLGRRRGEGGRRER